LPAHDRLEWKGLTLTLALAHFNNELITTVKYSAGLRFAEISWSVGKKVL
jgi:hypothetical protein